jgi:NAD+ synthetase
MRIAIAQIDPVVGAFDANVRKIQDAYERACAEQARLLLAPELAICGYPPHDLIERPEMFDRNERALQKLADLTRGKPCAIAVGHVAKNHSEVGRQAQNVISILENGKVVYRQAKTLLPTYDVFDEARYFEPATEIHPWQCDGKTISLAICEDLWSEDLVSGRHIYHQIKPIDSIEKCHPGLVISLSASPYMINKRPHREEIHAEIARRLGVPLIYVNQVGANDEVLFDGASFVADGQGKIVGRLPVFKTSFGIVDVDLEKGSARFVMPEAQDREDSAPTAIEGLSRGLVLGIRDYFQRTGFKTAILGLSGGIDSAVVATLAAHALGPKNVLGVAMPSMYSSSGSLTDAEALARNLGINFEVRPIKFLNSQAARELSERRGELAPLALENLQARLRGLLLMTLSNHYNSLVLTTGNKSELAVGYCTLYGDMCGALSPIGDVYKTQVYELANYLNEAWGQPIPQSSVTKPPSAELRPDQKDQDTLPPYDALDAVLIDYLENRVPISELEGRHLAKVANPDWIKKVLRLLEISEFKRRQAAPVLKVSNKAFGIGRRIPIAKFWDQSP